MFKLNSEKILLTIRKVTGNVNALGDIDIDIQLLEGYRVTKEEKSLMFILLSPDLSYKDAEHNSNQRFLLCQKYG